ncbi:26S Proteasome Non-Atpase Regulatory Subunit 3 [Manis pentadactyla]|nr:26S Proteasome Non-Atpase Regulatory Subunit 3 [Manis pentadactyla]
MTSSPPAAPPSAPGLSLRPRGGRAGSAPLCPDAGARAEPDPHRPRPRAAGWDARRECACPPAVRAPRPERALPAAAAAAAAAATRPARSPSPCPGCAGPRRAQGRRSRAGALSAARVPRAPRARARARSGAMPGHPKL